MSLVLLCFAFGRKSSFFDLLDGRLKNANKIKKVANKYYFLNDNRKRKLEICKTLR